jgi:hypothetical protein
VIWLTWRQFRAQALVVYGAAAVLAAFLAATGPHLAQQYRAHGPVFLGQVSGTDTALYVIGALAVLAVPFLIGMFWGAPLVTRELAAGTHRLAWTLTTPGRWLAAKLAVTGLAAMAAAGLLSLAVSWWAAPVDAAIATRDGAPGPGILIFPRLWPEIFDSRGIVPVGYAAFAFVLGVAIGVLVKRILPAMALLLAVLAVTQVFMSVVVRPNVIPPEHLTAPITAADLTLISIDNSLTITIDRPGAWLTGQHTVNAAGQPASPPSWVIQCPGSRPGDPDQACFARLARRGYRQEISYEPASRFWPLQIAETGIYLVLALGLAGLTAWRVRRRLS